METFISAISGKPFPIGSCVEGRHIRSSLMDYIHQTHPDFNKDQVMSTSELSHFRKKYIYTLLSADRNTLGIMEKEVLGSIAEAQTISDKLEDKDNELVSTVGQKIADKVATFGGSWTVILSFLACLVLCICINVFFLAQADKFDPYPFILLNLILSCIAALQAPVIMMSQNRQEEKDRDRAKKDYMINLKSELEIRIIHDKIDHFMLDQQQELIEMQRIQIDMLNEVLKRHPKS